MGERTATYHLIWGIWGGRSFPGLISNSSDWQPGTFRVTGLQVGFSKRLSPHWSAETQVAYHEFHLNIKGPREDYVFDFGSPQVGVGLMFHPQHTGFKRILLRLHAGGQLGYNGVFEELEPDYRVMVDAPAKAHFFLAPELGKMFPLTKPSRKFRFQLHLEVACYARWQWNQLGTAQIESAAGTLEVAPRGNALGLRIRLWGPVGRSNIKIEGRASDENSSGKGSLFRKSNN